jgi:ferritin-like metal-binding protein YciE
MLKHVEETQQHVRNLEQVFEAVGQSPKRQTCDGAKGLVKEGSIMAEEATGPVRDVVIVEAAEKVEAYEIMGYTSLISAAKALGQEEAAGLLERNLSDEERMAEQLAGVEAVVRDAMSE